MAVSRTHRYIVDPADLDELIARRATLIAAIRAAHPGLAEARLTRPQAINAIKALLVTAPDDLRQQLRDLSVTQLVRTAARLRPGAINDPDRGSQTGVAHAGLPPAGPERRDQGPRHRAGPAHREDGCPTRRAVWGRHRQRRRAAGGRRRQP